MILQKVEFEFLDDSLGFVKVSFRVGQQTYSCVEIKNESLVYVMYVDPRLEPIADNVIQLIKAAEINWKKEKKKKYVRKKGK